MMDSTKPGSEQRTVQVTVPARLAEALDRSPGGWDRLMGLVDTLGDGNASLGLDGVMGIVRAVLTQRSLDTCLPWTRTLAASQADGMTDDEVLFAFRLDGSQLPRIHEFRAVFRERVGSQPLDGVTVGEVADAEWLLRNMGIKSNLTEQFAAYQERVEAVRREKTKVRRSLESALVIPMHQDTDSPPAFVSRPAARRAAGASLH